MAAPVPFDRRHSRRQETIEQILDVAVDLMGEQGVAGLTLGEVARRMGIRPPSLYVYFDSKHALYDALFERGCRKLLDAFREALPTDDPLGDLYVSGEIMTRWSVENPAYAALMFWRPVPGFTPSDRAYAPAVESVREGRGLMARLQADGVIRPDVDLDLALRTWTVVLGGVVSQQLANAPHEPYETGTFTTTLPHVIAMWLAHHGGPVSPRPTEPGGSR